MKTIIAILILIFFLQVPSQAQIFNSDFEQLNSDGSLSYWGNIYIFSVVIDSSGSSQSDSIIFDNYFYAPSSDAHSGYTALELRNAWNYTQNTGIAGAVGADDDSIFSAWGAASNLVPINPNDPFHPTDFGFYYKFSPVNGDSAYAEIMLWDSSGNPVAEGKIIITQPSTEYTLAYTPLYYFSTNTAAFYSYTIHNFYTETPGIRQPSLGTRLLVDDLGFDFTITPIRTVENTDTQIDIFPNPANKQINIRSTKGKLYRYRICDVYGQIVREGVMDEYIYAVPTETFTVGMYTIIIHTGGANTEQHRFIISR